MTESLEGRRRCCRPAARPAVAGHAGQGADQLADALFVPAAVVVRLGLQSLGWRALAPQAPKATGRGPRKYTGMRMRSSRRSSLALALCMGGVQALHHGREIPGLTHLYTQQ